MAQELSAKKSMLIIWAVGTLLWIPFAGYMFDFGEVRAAYKSHALYEEKVAQSGKRSGYYYQAYKRAQQRMLRANKKLGLFFLMGFAFPGLLLAFGTAVMENADKPKPRARKPKK